MTSSTIIDQVDLVRLRLHIEFDEDCLLPPGFALQLRRELTQAGRKVLDHEIFCRLFEPAVPADTRVARSFQRPAPAFILKAGTLLGKTVSCGEEWQMDVLFIGSGISFIPDFIRVFQQVGQSGIFQGRGRFALIAAWTLGTSGEIAEFSLTGRGSAAQAPQMLPLSWLVETSPGAGNWRFEFITPARLISHGKPLFHPDFSSIFPFVLRRASAMLWHWGDSTFEVDARLLLEAADRVVVLDNQLCWHDWKHHPGVSEVEALGGVSGSLVLSGPALEDVFWILGLGALLHIGKGAAYGAGQYRLAEEGK